MEGLTQNEKIIVSCWDEKSPRDVVREAAAKGTYINLAIKYLMNKNTWNETTARDWFLAEVKSWTVQLLLRKQIFKVLHVLNKVEINPEEHLMTLARESSDIDYRDFLVENICKLTIKSENESKWDTFRNHWNLLRYLEKSFEVDGKFKQNKVFGTCVHEDQTHYIVVTESEIKSMTIENIETYPSYWKSKIATALFFTSFEFSLLSFSSPSDIWNYLVEKNKAMILIRWINVQMSEVVRDMNARYIFFNRDGFVKQLLNVDTSGFSLEVLEKLDESFRKWSITPEMIATVVKSNCFEYTKMCIYDTLCSYGIVNHDERNNLNQIISRLSRTENLKLIDDIFTESCSTITKQDFYVELAKYCVKNKLYNVLTICAEGNIVETDLVDVEQDAKDCIELWLLFKSIEQTSDRQSHVVPVYKTCQQIANNDIDNYISSNPQLVFGMILLEDDAKLFDIFSKEQFLQFKDFKLPNKGYKDKLPHLYNVYKKFSNSDHLFDFKDVNMYQLLAGYRGLDVSKIFEFQLVNQYSSNIVRDKADRRSLGSLLSGDLDVNTGSIKALSQRNADMPDFGNEKLMKRYGYVAHLNHLYYLKQYRPCNASQAFMAQQYQTYNRLQDKCIKNACCEAHAIALQNWNDSALTACAISFVAMIGCNPIRCRVHMSVANMIKRYEMNNGKTLSEANKIVNDYMLTLLQSSKDGIKETFYEILEDITMFELKKIQEKEGKVDITKILYELQTVVKFAMLHNLSLPEKQLREFIKSNSWFNFLLFGDVFRYPLAQMLQLTQEFEKKSYAEHLQYIMLHRNVDDSSEKDSNGQKRVSRMNSMEASSTQSEAFEHSVADGSRCVGGDLWEVAASCHGPEDPPAALSRAADRYNEPLLVLIASCYEPNAVDTLWAQWVLSSLARDSSVHEELACGETPLSFVDQFQRIASLCLRERYVTTLHESLLIFMPESPLTMLTAFLCRCVKQLDFDMETSKLLTSFTQHCLRKYSVDSAALPHQMSRDTVQRIAVDLVKVILGHGFDSAFHQRKFLKCLITAQFGKGFSVPVPNFEVLHEILQVSMETYMFVDVSKMLEDDVNEYLQNCVKIFTDHKKYDVALNIAKLANLSVDDILKAEWLCKYNELLMKDGSSEENTWTLFVAECSDAFEKAGVTFSVAVEFLVHYVAEMGDSSQQFYSYRIIMNLFEEHREFGTKREEIEHLMWNSYFECESRYEIFLHSYKGTLNFIFNGQMDRELARKIETDTDQPFSMTLNEIEVESDIRNIQKVVLLENPSKIEEWRRVIQELLELKLLVEAFRLSALFSTPPEYKFRPRLCPVYVFRTCLSLAEGTCSPYELPQELRLAITSPFSQSKLFASNTSDTSFEELVVIQGDGAGASLAGREDADRLSALEALAARGAAPVARHVASLFRIALQVGWPYDHVLKHRRPPLELVALVSGRARLPLASLVFRTFNVPTKQIAEYLCCEMVAAIISPHLIKTSTFRQKEHFQYTLWGYALNSDIEMFMNMRPDACSLVGRLILDHLMAFRKIYRARAAESAVEDIETIIDEEYLNVESVDVESVVTESTLGSEETESVYSAATVCSGKMSRDTRRNLFDAVNRPGVHVPCEVKANVRRITKGAKLSSKQVNVISIEILVAAHEWFSGACDTEGVATALRSAQALASQLLAARSWRLMVRLLTGLARYTEMAYIFQALRDNHQFEFLLGQFDYMLGQQPDKITEFKQGLLDYLRNHCPGDTDTYIMVALHFNMYAEAATVRKKQAKDLIDDLKRMAKDAVKAMPKRSQPVWLQIDNDVTTRSLLETALQHSVDGAELFLQGGCTGAAADLAAFAQLIALQLSLLNASPTRLILDTTPEQKFKLVSEYLSMMEGLVLMGGRTEGIWREVAYRRVTANDQVYLRDLATYRPDIAHQFISRYETQATRTKASEAAIKELRNLCR